MSEPAFRLVDDERDGPRVPIFETLAVSKSFPSVRALSGVDFRLFPGEIHALMGQNGAGKSTLINLLTGVCAPDQGEVRLGGQAVHFCSPQDADAAGIRTLYQEINLCPNLSVAENIFIGRQPMHGGSRGGPINWAEMRRRATEVLAGLNLSLDVRKTLDCFPIAVQQMIAIARATCVEARVLILDEPTSSLDEDEVARLFVVLRQLKQRGMAILFVTHFLEQVYAISDRITVLRNGERVGEYWAKDLSAEQLIEKMVGHNRLGETLTRTVDTKFSMPVVPDSPQNNTVAQPPPLVSLEGVARRGMMQALDLEIKAGEILGLAGLLGSGRTETAQLLFGVERADAGSIVVGGTSRRFRSPRDAIREGIAYCPEDRKREGIVAELSIRENIILALQAKRGWLRKIGRRQQQHIAEIYIARLGIKAADIEQPIGLLSGGNQQKALLGRWLATHPALLILDEPTRGIDVAAKFEIMQEIRELCAKGLGLLFISSEISEVTRISHRVAVLKDRRKIAELSAALANEDAVYKLIAGVTE